MAKTKKQIIEDLKLIDVVVEVLDARAPKASVNQNIRQHLENKKWVKYFESNNIPAVLINANIGTGIDEVIRKIEKVYIEDKQGYESKGRKGKSIRVLILGIPNVGKSSFINRITKKAVAGVGNKPGVTKQKQWVRVNENIELLDTPGILWPKFEDEQVALKLAYIGTIKDDILEKVEIAYNLLKYLLENEIDKVAKRYSLNIEELQEELNNVDRMENENILEIMYIIGRKRGAIVSGGRIDEEKVANIIIEDFRSGKFGKITLEKI